MTGFAWSLVGAASRLLEGEEREVVLGDLYEAGTSSWSGLADVAGLIVRREAALWRSWRPWLAGFGLSLPASFLLMGISLSVSNGYQLCAWLLRNHPLFDPKLVRETGLMVEPQIEFLLCRFLLLIGLAWTVGFVVGRVSRRTLWMSALLCLSPCLFCLARFRIPEMSRVSLLLFLLPAIWGAWCGLRVVRIRLVPGSCSGDCDHCADDSSVGCGPYVEHQRPVGGELVVVVAGLVSRCVGVAVSQGKSRKAIHLT